MPYSLIWNKVRVNYKDTNLKVRWKVWCFFCWFDTRIHYNIFISFCCYPVYGIIFLVLRLILPNNCPNLIAYALKIYTFTKVFPQIEYQYISLVLNIWMQRYTNIYIYIYLLLLFMFKKLVILLLWKGYEEDSANEQWAKTINLIG